MMNSSARRTGWLYRNTAEPEDIFILGESNLLEFSMHPVLATAAEIVAAAESRARTILVDAEEKAAGLIAEAQTSSLTVLRTAHDDGFESGHREAAGEVEQLLALVRAAAADGKAVRDGLAAQAANVVATATGLALRRLTADYYEFDPERTAQICAEALRAASGQEVLALRVNPAVASSVQVALVDSAAYVRPDDSVAIGGCIIDLRHGTLDATLDARLSLMEMALLRAAGGDSE